ncbi:MAG TPA: alanine--glyoxylate aminotransferase family protein [Anaerolineaceae bacterium]|jgi:alanine-glyoxylate transaminase/serine-glyoxylate transaminase/serine-pyruvate transaminase
MDNLLNFPELAMPPRILLGPGPSLVDPRVQRAMLAPMVGHLDPEFLILMDRTQQLLRQVFETENELTFPISGTGTAGMEAAVANMVEPGDRVLVCIAGYFGERIAEMARRYGGQVETLLKPWGEVFDPAEIRQALLKSNPARLVAIVQAETATGALQPLEEIAQVTHESDALLLVDSVTALGGVPVGVDRVGIDICYSGSQKCLGCPPGLAPLSLSRRAVEKLDSRQAPPPNFYLDLGLLRKYWGPERAYHHTAPITMMYALYEGLRVVVEEGLEQRWARHLRNAGLLWQGLQDMGMELHVPIQNRLPPLTTVRIPTGVDDVQVRRRLLAEYNIEISGGLGELKGKVWRIGLMGFSSRPELVELLLAALKKIL